MSVNNSARSGDIKGISFSIFFDIKICCVFSLESPHRCDSNEYTQNTIFDIKKKIILNYPKFAAIGFCSKRLNNEYETAVVNEPSVFKTLKFYCSYVCVGLVSLIHRTIFLSLAYVWFILFYNE